MGLREGRMVAEKSAGTQLDVITIPIVYVVLFSIINFQVYFFTSIHRISISSRFGK